LKTTKSEFPTFTNPLLSARAFPLQVVLVLACLFCLPAQAELLGMIAGRSANLSYHSSFSVEAGYSWYTRQLQWSTARINLKPAEGLQLYLDAANLQASSLPIDATRTMDFTGTGFGGGIVFRLPKLLTRFDLAFKAAFHSAVIGGSPVAPASRFATVSNTSVITEAQSPIALQQTQWSGEVLISPIERRD